MQSTNTVINKQTYSHIEMNHILQITRKKQINSGKHNIYIKEINNEQANTSTQKKSIIYYKLFKTSKSMH